jgi:hypothetical protein
MIWQLIFPAQSRFQERSFEKWSLVQMWRVRGDANSGCHGMEAPSRVIEMLAVSYLRLAAPSPCGIPKALVYGMSIK